MTSRGIGSLGVTGHSSFVLRHLSLVNRQAGVVELEDDQVEGGRVDGADVSLRPLGAGLVPYFYFLSFVEQFAAHFVAVTFPALAAFSVLDLRIVEVGIVPVAIAA